MTGSSPLSRGIRAHHRHHLRAIGIIPALAGNTDTEDKADFAGGDHPRSRGEYSCGMGPRRSERGSSPLSRGIHAAMVALSEEAGIIPALAGNTNTRVTNTGIQKDHPRSRGEYRLGDTPWQRQQGSSPLSRGIRRSDSVTLKLPGIIPALAGNTIPQQVPPRANRDHPRSRGEYVASG